MRPKSTHPSIEVSVPQERLFTWLVARWETGDPLGTGTEARPTAVMGDGFAVPCPPRPWRVPDGTTVVVDAFSPPDGWRAIGRGRTVTFELRLTPSAPARTRLACAFDYEPAGLADRGRELLFARRARSRALRLLLKTWKSGAERAEALGRLRGSQRVSTASQSFTGSTAPDSPPDTGGTDDHT